MLQHLEIKNYALIRQLELSPSPGMNIITGETGAGKSIMLGAIGLLLGNRAENKTLFDETEKCIIEGVFDLAGYHLEPLFEEYGLDFDRLSVIRREIMPGGKTRGFINDTPANLEAMREIGRRLIDIHSQHDTLQLASNAYQLGIVDAYATNAPLRQRYAEAFTSYRKASRTLDELVKAYDDLQREFDFKKHQLDELDQARLDGVDQAAMEAELQVLENAESIKNNLGLGYQYLAGEEHSTEGSLKAVLQLLSQIANYGEKYAQLRERVNSCLIELQDVAYELEREEGDLVLDGEKIMALQDRLNALYRLQKKHRTDNTADLIRLRDRLQEEVDRVVNFDEDLRQAREAQEAARKVLEQVAGELSMTRIAVLPQIEEEINALLSDLGMPNARLSIQHRSIAFAPEGSDEIRFLFSANKGGKPDELKNVASGGEFSRLMLCIKYVLAGKTAMPTVIFDEIDTGISGEIAIKVANMMRDMAKRHQLIAISHLPQIAAKGQSHYFIYKDHSGERTESRVRTLTHEERIREIAQMIGGANPSTSAFVHAQEMLEGGV